MSQEGFPLQAGSYNAETLRRAAMGVPLLRGSTVGSVKGGLVGSTDLQTTAGSGMHVETSAGECMVEQEYATTGGPVYYINKSTLTTAVPAASTEHPRIDLLVAQVEDAAYHGSTNEVVAKYLTGTPTAGATLSNKTGAPSVPTSALALAYIEVPTSASSLTNGNIENVAGLLVPGLRSATYREGTAAERPAAAVKGRIWYATNTHVYSVDTGSAWVETLPSISSSSAYGAWVERVNGTEYEPSATRPTVVVVRLATALTGSTKGIVGLGVQCGAIEGVVSEKIYVPEPGGAGLTARLSGSFVCPAGTKWKTVETESPAALTIESSYLPL